MSYDIRIWTTRLPDVSELTGVADASLPVAEGRGWLINAGTPLLVEPEDVPEQIAKALPGIAHLVELTLEPLDAPASALVKLRALAKRIATAGHGVVEDPQAGSMTFGNRVQRLSSLGSDDDAALMSMSFWYEFGPLSDPDAAPGLLDLLSRHLPEALPARYGEFEPPQFRLERDGRSHLDEFMRQHWREFAVYYPSAPVAHFHISLPQPFGPSRRGYRSGHLVIDIDTAAFSQPRWQAAVVEAWRALVQFVHPFYADVRRLRHYSRTRGRYWLTSETERHPICSWWWSGIPRGSVYAIALGEPYFDLWPELVAGSERLGSVVVRIAPDWRDGATPLSLPNLPSSIAQVQHEYEINSDRVYPDTWPFASPRT